MRRVLLLLGCAFAVACGEAVSPSVEPKTDAPETGTANSGVPPAEEGDGVLERIEALSPDDPAGIADALADTGRRARESWGSALPDLLARMAAAGRGVEVSRLLRDASLPPERETTAVEVEAVRKAFLMLERRRLAEAEAAVSGLDDPPGSAALLRALVALRRGDPHAFGYEIGIAIVRGLKPVDARIAAGRILAELGALDEAEETLTGVENPRALAPLAVVRLARGEVDGAVETAERAVDENPADPVAARVRVLVLAATGRLEEAEAALVGISEGIEEDPALLEARGTLLARQGDSEGAKRCFEKAVDLDPGSAVAHRNLAGLLFAAGRDEDALRHLEAALAGENREQGFFAVSGRDGSLEVVTRGEGIAAGYRALARRYLARGVAADRVQACLERATRADPLAVEGWELLAAFLERTGNPMGAVTALGDGSAAVSDAKAPGLRLLQACLALREDIPDSFRLAAAELPGGSPEAAFVARISVEGEGAAVRLPGRPATRIATGSARYASLASALAGTPVEIGDRSDFRAWIAKRGDRPVKADAASVDARLDAGDPALLEIPDAGARGVRDRFVLVVGRIRGGGAYVLDDPDPASPGVVLAAAVAGGLLYRPGGDEDADPEAEAIVAAFGRLEAGSPREAIVALPEGSAHPLAALVAVRAGPTGTGAVERAIEVRPELPELQLLLAESHLAAGEVEDALAAANRALRMGPGRGAGLVVRRIRALAKLSEGTLEEGLAELEAIRSEHPGYLPVYEDLAGNYLVRGRYRPALLVLRALSRRAPETRKRDGYRAALRRAESGLASQATTRSDVDLVIASEDPEIRRLAVMAAAGLDFEDATEVLSSLSGDEEASVRAYAVRMIGERGFRGALPAVLGAFDDESKLVRGAAARATRQVGGADAARRIVALLGDPELYVREVAVRELRALAGRRFGYDPAAPEVEQKEAIRRWEEWTKRR